MTNLINYGNPSPKVKILAEGIALAEGFGIKGTLPTRLHNPGDLKLGDIGYGEDNEKTIMPDDATGWAYLYRQCAMMLNGDSHVYEPSMTFLQVAVKYTGNDNPVAWANIVAGHCGMQVNATLEDFRDGAN